MTTMTKKLILLSNHSIQTYALGLYLQPKLEVNLSTVDINSHPLQLNAETDALILVDLASLNEDTALSLQQELKRYSASIALLNAQDGITFDEIIAWPNIYGYFNCIDNLDDVCRGLKAMMAGEYWMPRKLMTKLINHYRRHQVTDDFINYEPTSGISLTCREEEILRALTKSTSNIEIAHQLFVSEYTVKSHLYNIFKKIEVKNRQQAIAWAKSSLH
ncbi:LuxR C-terminal-related transcriptional regulator [Photobacterium sagamiensis]|uniref:LuxR C-terminal-related transcriptional regulator n=1 Tax=Photobacterium sagamiensis TaxID=2910241 RepID=UPI003D14199F